MSFAMRAPAPRLPLSANRGGCAVASALAVVAGAACMQPRTQVGVPLSLPPVRQAHGNVSWKAVVDVTEGDKPAGKVVGFSKSVTIARETQNACRLHKPRTAKCGEAQLIMQTARAGDSGIFWVSQNGTVRQLV